MIKEAIQYIVGLGHKDIYEINGQNFATGSLQAIEEPRAAALEVRSLSGLVEYIKSNFDGEKPLMVHVISPTRVTCFDALNKDANRSVFLKASAMLPEFQFNRYTDSEKFNIKLQSAFLQTEDRDVMLKVVGNIEEASVNTVGDDGVSQSVVARTGVATKGNVLVPNPVRLMPYRTFVEVDQPESNFVFRMQKGPECALFEADGGAWELEAMKNIKDYLTFALEEEIMANKVIVIA